MLELLLFKDIETPSSLSDATSTLKVKLDAINIEPDILSGGSSIHYDYQKWGHSASDRAIILHYHMLCLFYYGYSSGLTIEKLYYILSVLYREQRNDKYLDSDTALLKSTTIDSSIFGVNFEIDSSNYFKITFPNFDHTQTYLKQQQFNTFNTQQNVVTLTEIE